MKKIGLMVLAALIAASPAAAATKKKAKRAKPAPAAAQVDPNANAKRLVADSLPSFLPAPLKFIYFSQQNKK